MATLPFQFFNNYYDLLYHDKNYRAEAKYVSDLIKEINPEANELIELGCGTGNYSAHFCNMGYVVTGVELSEQMVGVAQKKSIKGFTPLVGDIENFNLGRKYDVAVSLFHVISYLNKNTNVISCLKHIGKHLEKGGIFIFDVWYTPAVYSQKPEKRVKKVETKDIEIARSAKPEIFYQKNIVEVNYELLIRSKANEQVQVLKETHSMRHFSTPEIELFAETAGFVLIKSEEFLTAKEPDANTWGVCYVLQKQ